MRHIIPAFAEFVSYLEHCWQSLINLLNKILLQKTKYNTKPIAYYMENTEMKSLFTTIQEFMVGRLQIITLKN